MIKTTVAKILTVKIAALGIAASAAGGVALAASNGSLPDPVQRHVPGYTTPSNTTTISKPSATPVPSGAPESLTAICLKYQGRDQDQRLTALRSEAEFRELLNRLNGVPDQEKANALCAELSRGRPSGSPDVRMTDIPNGSMTQRPGSGAEPSIWVSPAQPGKQVPTEAPSIQFGNPSFDTHR